MLVLRITFANFQILLVNQRKILKEQLIRTLQQELETLSMPMTFGVEKDKPDAQRLYITILLRVHPR